MSLVTAEIFNSVREKFEKQYPEYKILFLTQVGSTLYGTNSEGSDIDLKGVFVPSKQDVLLKRDAAHWVYTTNNTNEKNTAHDVDCQLFSVYKFFDLLENGETGVVDLLFSAFREDTTLMKDPVFTDFLMKNYTQLITRRMSAFVGYCVSQSKRYGMKGKRYKELLDFTNHFASSFETSKTIAEVKEELKAHISEARYEYISIEEKATSRDGSVTADYLVVNGRSFLETNNFKYVLTRLNEIKNTYGHRSEKAAKGVDAKALSHALRVMLEAIELLDTGMVKFPLAYSNEIKRVKYSGMSDDSAEFERLMNRLTHLTEVVDEKMKTSTLPEKMNRKLVDEFTLKLVKDGRGIIWNMGRFLKDCLERLT
jgi:predicted nucleotidyltransferase